MADIFISTIYAINPCDLLSQRMYWCNFDLLHALKTVKSVPLGVMSVVEEHLPCISSTSTAAIKLKTV